MIFKYSSNTFFGIKNEATQSIEATVAVSDFITVQDATAKIGKDTIVRDYKRGSMDTLQTVIGARWLEGEVTVELRNSASAGYPELQSLFTMCMASSSTITGTSSIFPISTCPPSMSYPGISSTTNTHYDGQKFVGLGGVGDFSFDLEAGKIPLVKFKLTSMLSGSGPVEISNPVVTGNLVSAAPIVQSINLKVGTYAPIAVNKLTFNAGVKVEKILDVNSPNAVYAIVCTGRDPKITIDPLVDTFTNSNPIADMMNGTSYSVSAQIGTVAGNNVAVLFPSCSNDTVEIGERNGIRVYNITANCNGTGQDSWFIKLQ
jgi:hypothetical protein